MHYTTDNQKNKIHRNTNIEKHQSEEKQLANPFILLLIHPNCNSSFTNPERDPMSQPRGVGCGQRWALFQANHRLFSYRLSIIAYVFWNLLSKVCAQWALPTPGCGVWGPFIPRPFVPPRLVPFVPFDQIGNIEILNSTSFTYTDGVGK